MIQALGVIDCTNEEYHASDGISRTKLWKFKQLPHKYWYEYLSGHYQPPEESDAFLFGNLLHTLVLEPDKFEDRFITMPDIDRRTKQGKTDYASFLEMAANKRLIKEDMLEQAYNMSESLQQNSTIKSLLDGARVEQSIFWEHKPTGLICKARPDAWNGSIVSDLKTTQDASYRSFQSSSYAHGYFLQAGMVKEAMLSIGEKMEHFVFICQEKKPPYSLAIYKIDEEALDFGREMYHALMERIAQCFEKDIWPDYGIQKLSVPKYASMEMEIE